MRTLNAAEPQFPADDGAADPAVAATLAAYAAGHGSEHAALTALAASRLLIPVVAVLTAEESGGAEPAGAEPAGPGPAAAGPAGAGRGELRREKSTEMALPTLIGRDGRTAILAFTCQEALTRWRPGARPVPVPAARAWLAGTQDASAVVIDVAGPVPFTVEGARLAALAARRPAPLPHQDPDVLAALHAALAPEQVIVQAALTTPGQVVAEPAEPDPGWPGSGEDTSWLDGGDSAADRVAEPPAAAPAAGPPPGAAPSTGAGPGGDGAAGPAADLALRVTLAAGTGPAAAEAAVGRVTEALLTATGGRLRRGIAVSVIQPRPGGRG